mgnify:CR=1 FL=1
MNEVLVGVDLGGTNLKAAVVSGADRVIAKLSRPTEEQNGPDHVIARIEHAIHDVITESGRSLGEVAAIGVGAPGLLDWRRGYVYSLTNMTGWTDIALGEILQGRFKDVPCFVENDANAACWGEFWLGAGRDVDTMCMLTLGTGVGGGIVVNGRLHRGIDGTAGEIGHMIVNRDGRQCGCGAHGCLEAYASVTGLVRTALERIDAGARSSLTEIADDLTGELISQHADAGDPVAIEVVEDTAKWLGVGISVLIALLNPECVALAGGMVAAGGRLLDTVRSTVDKEALGVPARRARVVLTELGGDAGVIGAAGCALSRLQS